MGGCYGVYNKKKKPIKKKPKTEYIMFVDETDPTATGNYFCLSGVIIQRNDYENNFVDRINRLKKTHFNDCDIIFHYTEMKNNRNNFKIFKDPIKRNKFYMDFVNILQSSDITILSSYFDKNDMKATYGKCAVSDYDVAFKTLLENFVHFLRNNNGDGMIIMESRLFNENANLQNTFYQYINMGSELFSSSIVKYHLKCLGFVVKNDNCIGLQIADFIPATIVRIIKDKIDKFSIQKTIHEKIYCHDTEYEKILGIRNILGNDNN